MDDWKGDSTNWSPSTYCFICGTMFFFCNATFFYPNYRHHWLEWRSRLWKCIAMLCLQGAALGAVEESISVRQTEQAAVFQQIVPDSSRFGLYQSYIKVISWSHHDIMVNLSHSKKTSEYFTGLRLQSQSVFHQFSWDEPRFVASSDWWKSCSYDLWITNLVHMIGE